MTRTLATCHPDKKYQGRGLCKTCYQREYKRGLRGSEPRTKMTITCHPEREAHAKGLCKACYMRQLRVERSATGSLRPHKPYAFLNRVVQS